MLELQILRIQQVRLEKGVRLLGLLMLLAGFSFLCLGGCVALLICSQKLLHRAFDMVNYIVGLCEMLREKFGVDFDADVFRKEGTD